MAIKLGQGVVDLLMNDKMLQAVADRVTSRLNKLKQGFEQVNKVSKWVFAGTGAVMGLSLKAYADAERVGARLNASLDKTGKIAGKTADQISALADKFQKVTKFEDEAVISAATVLGTFKSLSEETFDRALQASADMAEFWGGDLSSTARMLGRALEDPVRGMSLLTRQGIVFTSAEIGQVKAMLAVNNKAGAQAVILKKLEGAYKGAAVAAGQTLTGQMVRLQNSVGNVSEAIGEALAPAYAKLLESTQGVVDATGEMVKAHPKATAGMLGTTLAVSGSALAFERLVRLMDTIANSKFSKVLLFGFGKVAGIAAVITASLAAMVYGLGTLDGKSRSWSENFSKGLERIHGWLSKVKDGLVWVADHMPGGGNTAKNVGDVVKNRGVIQGGLDNLMMAGLVIEQKAAEWGSPALKMMGISSEGIMAAQQELADKMYGTTGLRQQQNGSRADKRSHEVAAAQAKIDAEARAKADAARLARARELRPYGLLQGAVNRFQNWRGNRNSALLAEWGGEVAGRLGQAREGFGDWMGRLRDPLKDFRPQYMGGEEMSRSMQLSLLSNSAEMERKRQERERTDAAKKSNVNEERMNRNLETIGRTLAINGVMAILG
jgi:hypothetical protein